MKIISPIDNLPEAEALITAGADELYGGYVPENWRNRFSSIASINQRTFDSAQISSKEDLEAIISVAHSAECLFSLTLNAPFYTETQLPMIVDYVSEIVSAGVDGIILADISLLRELGKRFPDTGFHASTLAHLGNSLAAEVYAGSGIDRMIFPRHIPVSEMAQIVRSCPGMAFDAFLLVGKCPNTEGLCTFHHSSGNKVWPCEIPYEIEAMSGEVSGQLGAAIVQQGSWSATNRRHGCGLCAIPGLIEAGVSGVKLVGRGAPSVQKVKNILLVKDFIELAKIEKDYDSYRLKAMAAHEQRFGSGCSPNVCYYPEFYIAE